MPDDPRPPVAIGHVRLPVNDVPSANDYLQRLGLRPISLGADFSVMELRGGTHLVVAPAEARIAPGTRAPFDLMVDDVEAALGAYRDQGFETSQITRGRIHASFIVSAPDGYEIQITSSHAGNRAI